MSGEGYFPRGSSILRRVHDERLVGLFYGQRALCIGALMPLNYVGTMAHTHWRDRLFQRLAHTAEQFETVYFGTRAQADALLVRVHRMHRQVHGTLPFDAGATAKGTAYDAFNPELMLWTVAIIAESALHFYELFIGRLSDAEREAYWQDYLRFGELFGTPRESCPRTYVEFRQWWDAQLNSELMYLTEEARYVGHATAFRIPLPPLHQPFTLAHNAIQLGSLPPVVREHYGLRYGPADRLAYAAAVAGIRAGRIVTPDLLAKGSSAIFYRQIAVSEARRIARDQAPVKLAGRF
ncbi:MAG: DUF2236 domain-containing protein [Solirubrobacterales bacterium]|nr:DUF2236 domain-containing protein [Solirubrobacterales bacterium]